MLAAAAPACALAQDAVPVQVAAPERGEVIDRRELTGTVTAERNAALSARVSGLVSEIAVDAGDHVERGALLLQLDPALAQLELQRSRAAVEEGEVALAEARRLSDEAAELAAQRNLAQTQARTRAAQARLSEAALTRLRAEQALQAERVERHALRTPFAGVVARRLVDVGEWVDTGTPVFELVATDALRFDVQAPQELLPVVQEGVTVPVMLDALPERRIDGTVSARVPVGDASARTFLVRIALPDGIDAAPGMSGRAAFALARRDAAWLLPRDALVRYPDGSTGIWLAVDEDGGTVARPRKVALGRTLGDRIEIRDGMAAGDRVIVRGNETLRDGQRVDVRDGAG